MFNPAKVTNFLRTHMGQRYCDDCLTEIIPLANRHEAQQATSTLAGC